MPAPILGLHHVTAIASDPQRVLDFYIDVLGMRLVKRTVNFDDPGTYHFYFGDDTGSPGSILSFFPWPGASRGSLGVGQTSATAFSVPSASLEYWHNRLTAAGVPVEIEQGRFGDDVLLFADPDGMRLELICQDGVAAEHPPRFADVPPEHSIRGFFGVTLCEGGFAKTAAVLEKLGFKKSMKAGSRYRFIAQGAALAARVDVLVQTQLNYGRLGRRLRRLTNCCGKQCS